MRGSLWDTIYQALLLLGVIAGMTLITFGNSTASFECRAMADEKLYPHLDARGLAAHKHSGSLWLGSMLWSDSGCHAGECILTTPTLLGWWRQHINVPMREIDAFELEEDFYTRFEPPNERKRRVVLGCRGARHAVYTHYTRDMVHHNHMLSELRHVLHSVETVGHAKWTDKPNLVVSMSGLVLLLSFSLLLVQPYISAYFFATRPQYAWDQ